MPLLSPWISRGLWFLGGYILSLWASNAKDGDEDEDLRIATRRQKTVRRPPPPAEELKLVLVVNDSLKMGKGKIGEAKPTDHSCSAICCIYRSPVECK